MVQVAELEFCSLAEFESYTADLRPNDWKAECNTPAAGNGMATTKPGVLMFILILVVHVI